MRMPPVPRLSGPGRQGSLAATRGWPIPPIYCYRELCPVHRSPIAMSGSLAHYHDLNFSAHARLVEKLRSIRRNLRQPPRATDRQRLGWFIEMDIISIICGLIAICIGVFGKEFYSGDSFTVSGYKREERVSTWWGRIVFLLVGAMFIIAAVISLITGRPLDE